MKGLAILVLIVLILSNVSAIVISEVESNPEGTDKGNEWIELYNDDEISLEGYKIVNGDGKELNLSGNFSGYFIYSFEKQWLDNSNESVSLYDNNSELVDKTALFDDSENNDLTWQLCNGSWLFRSSTKGKENNCSIEQNTTNNETNETSEESNETEETSDSGHASSNYIASNAVSSREDEETAENLTPISLGNSKDIKTENNKENLVKNLPLYGIMGFCVLFGVLFFLKAIGRKKKNEFR